MKSVYHFSAAPRAVAARCGRSALFVCFLLTAFRATALNYYWVNGNGAWSQFAAHWAKIPNPAVSADYYPNVPGSMDDVHFGANGGTAYTVNVDAGSTVPKCRNMDWTGVPAGTVWGGGGGRMDIYGSLKMDPSLAMTFNGEVHFISNDAATKQVWSKMVHFSSDVFFEGTSGGWLLMDELYCGSFLYHHGGLLNTNGQKVTVLGQFKGNYQGPTDGQLQLGNSEFNIVGYGYFNYSPAQFDAGTSHIKILGANQGLVGPINFTASIHFYDVSFLGTCTSGGFSWGNIDGTLTFHQFGRIYSHSLGGIPVLNNVVFLEDGWIANATNYNHLTLTAGKTYTIENYAFNTGTDQTILPGGSLTAMGAGTCSEFITIKSWKYGTAFKFVNNSGTDIMTGCIILEDVHAAGTNTLTVNDGLDLGNNTGWIFVNPHGTMNLYWVGGAGDWDDPCHWTANPVGTVGDCNCTPNGATNVYFTANSGFSSDPLDVERVSTPANDAYIAFRDMDWSGVTGNPTYYTVSSGSNISEQYIYGSLTYSPNMVHDFRGTTRFRTIGSCSLLSAGQTFKDLVIFEGAGELSFLDAFNYSNWAPNYYDVYHLRGTIKTLGNSITLGTNNGWQGNKDLNNNFVDQGAELWLGEVGGNSSTVSFDGNAAFVAAYEAGKFHAVQSHIKPEGLGNITVTTENRPHDFWNVSFINNYVATFYGGILNKLTFDRNYGVVGNSTPNRLIHEMEMKDDGEINGNQTFDIITLTGGNGYTLQNGTVQTITSGGAFNTTSDCEHYVTLTSGLPDKTSAIKKEGGGALTINNVVLDNITGDLSTGATYTALNGVALGTTTGWSVFNPPARTLYWVGGNGNWNSAAHWSLASGGTGGECPPTPLDNVFFNGTSGLDAANVVTISQLHVHCKNMDWTGVGNGTKLTGSCYLNIYGNLTFSAGMDYENYYATYFRAQQPVTITSAGNKYYYVYFWSPTGEWTLMDDFETVQDVDVYHYYGTLRSNNHTIGVGRIWWGATTYYTIPGYTTSPTAKLILGSSKVKIYPTAVWAADFFASYPANNFAAGTSEIIFESGVYSTLASTDPDLAFHNVTFKEKDGRFSNSTVLGKLLFEKDGILSGVPGQYVHEVEFKDDAIMYGSLNFHIMKFAPGKRYTFLEGRTTTIVPFNGQEGQFIAQGLPGQYIEMKSSNPSVPAIIHMDDYNGTSTCTKYLFLTGMTHTGTEDIYVPTPGGNVFNNSGWQFFPCNPCPASIPVLAANSITVGCAPGKAKLILDGLKPDEWAIWYTDPAAMTNIVYNGGTTGPAGNLFEPLITGPTTYYARVYSDGGLCESTVILTVSITTITPPAAFNVTGSGMVCAGSAGTPIGLDGSAIGVSYQLQINGVDVGSPVNGTGAAIPFGNQTAAGTYTVVATIVGTGCPADMNGSAVVTGNPLVAPAVVASSNAPLCVGSGALQLSEGGGELVNWSWTGPGGYTSTDQNPVILNPTPANSGLYTVTGSSANGCTNSQSVLVTVYPQPDATITTTLQVCPGTVNIGASVPDAGPGATYTWTILNGIFNSGLGTNSITYTAGGPGQTVLSVSVVGAGGCLAAGCNNTFIQSLGNMGGSQPNIFPHPNGDFFATGLRNDSMVIVRFDPGGTPLWAHAFRLGTNTLLIRDMIVDASGDLIGVAYYETGAAADAKSTVFRYNIASHTFVWVQHISDVLFTNIHSFDANNCVLTGTGNGGYTQLAQIDKSTGAISTYALQGEGGDYYSVLQNGHLYGACRRYYNSDGDFRASIFSHDAATGAFEWQNSLISEGDALGGPTKTRMYPEKPAIDNDSLLMLASGDLVGFSGYFLGSPQEMVVAKTDLLGNLGWTKQYLVAGYDRPVAARIANTADGYYIVGNLYLPALSNFGFGVLIKTDKQGNVQWAKRLGISGKNIVKNIMERNGFLHLVMASDSYAPDELLLLKLDLQGNSNTTCDFIQPISVTINHLPKIQNARPYSVTNRVSTLTPVVETPNSTSYSKVARCSTPCSNSLTVSVVQPDAGFISGNSSICVDEVALLTSTGVSGGFWGSSDPSIAQVDANTGYVFGIAPGNCFIAYFVTVNGCTNSTDFPLEVRPLPALIPVSNSPVCSGSDLMLNEIGGEAVSWNWFNGNGYYAGGIHSPIIQNATPANSGIYTVGGTGQNGCTNYADVNVVVNPLPAIRNDCSQTKCESAPGSGQATFDLTERAPCITLEAGGVGVRFFTDAALAQEILAPATFLSPTATVYTVVTNTSTGCTSSGTMQVTVLSSAPVPVQANLPAITNCGPAVAYAPTAFDPCNLNGPVIYGTPSAPFGVNLNTTPPSYLVSPGNYAVTWTYNSGFNTSTQLQLVTIHPMPVVACPFNQAVGLADPAISLTSATPAGGVYTGSGVINGLFDPLAAGLGVHVMSYNYSDANNCPGSCSFTITVQNLAPPAITCPTNIVLNNASGQCGAVVNYPLPTATAPLGIPTLTILSGLPSGGFFPVGTTVLVWQATGSSGLTATCSFTVTVNDNQNPTLVCPANMVRNTDPGQCSAVVNYTMTTVNDNCPGWSLIRTGGLPSGSVFPKGITMVNWKVTDAAGNMAICGFTVTVNDNQTPTIVCPPDIVRSTAANSCYSAAVFYAVKGLTDNCPGVTGTFLGSQPTTGLSSGSPFPKGVTTITLKATDAAGGMKTCSFSVTVNDAQPPAITCPANIALNTAVNQCTAITTYATPTFTDNCAGGSVAILSGLASGTAFPKGMTTVVWKATDAAGLTKTCTFKVTVNDVQAPLITCPANASVPASPGQCGALAVTYTTPTFTDNCAGTTLTRTGGPASGAAFPAGATPVTWKATDAAGNFSVCTFTVTVTDAQPPAIGCPPNMMRNTDLNHCSAVVTYPQPTATDNCAGATSFLFAGLASGSEFPLGATINVWRAFDGAGLSSTCSFTVTVSDAQAPAMICPPNATVNASGNPCGWPSAQLTLPTASDNCAVTSLTSNAPASLPPGATVVIWTAKDAANNAKTCSQTVTVECGTGVSSSKFEVRSSNLDQGLGLVLAPNPASAQVSMVVTGTGEQGELAVFDPLGRMVWKQAVAGLPMQELMLDVSGPEFPAGIYQVRLRTAAGSVTRGLVVVKM